MGGSLNTMGGRDSTPGVLIYGSKTDEPGMGWGASRWGKGEVRQGEVIGQARP